MLFVDVPLDKWMKRWNLKVIEGTCDGCGKKLTTTKPFVSKDYAGLASEPCSCGKQRHKAMTMIGRTDKVRRSWECVGLL